MKTKILHLAILTFLLSGCKSTSNEYLLVDGNKYKRNNDGSITVNKEQIDFLKGKSNIVVLASVMQDGGLAVTDKELQLLSKDKQLLSETVNNSIESDEVFTFLIRQGSLKKNLERLSEKYNSAETPLSLDYGDVDYFVEESKIVRATSVDELLAEALNSFPVFAQIQGVTFFVKQGSLKDNLKRLSDKFSTSEMPLRVEYEGGDLHVPESKLVKAGSVEELVSTILSPYPVFSVID
ncbi:MAG: hypothetical protein CML20_14420 [Rheinheimera sp.]|nr:hypothetical protein [Rheinheimera sp.]